MNDQIKHKMQHNLKRAITSVKWIIFAILVGIIVGLCGTAFYFGMSLVTVVRTQNPWLIFFLPIGGLAIVALYHMLHDEKDTGTNLVLSAIHSDDELPFRMAPLIFISTLITHLLGGSAGREGAALQMGGSLGNTLGKLFHFDEKDKHVMIMCGMSAAFSALFGTPMAAAIFPMEVVSVGVMYYAALVPCVISSLIAHGIAYSFGVSNEMFLITDIPAFSVGNSVRISILAVLCALVSILFCVALHESEHLYKKFFQNPYLRVFVGGCIVLFLTLLVGNQNYNGTGINIIAQCIDGSVRPEAFLLKIIFTACTLGAGYKGGEIVPSFFIGAAFGCLFGLAFGFSPTLCTAVGMTAVFCGVTNCPISSLLISFELFGYDGMPYFLLSVALSYMLSGYFGLYRSQKIIYSKYKTNYINKSTL
ncbi:chloride channel protein [Roseburia sp. MUC/MUC-530-WT-4D]|uniref:Chloride channel protein n=1 Tax=Roseburia porci TaxID=2605790 RepID=A0A6L5YQ43_9FIRM|nr:chloride channel protein [Roseburia porci]MCI5516078.1 chloride channel protein [Roseburia sp.]MDD6742919.1 chloride channel protein [Roseburia porci]MST74604.1 chloride channel protein [Roseburia porci]